MPKPPHPLRKDLEEMLTNFGSVAELCKEKKLSPQVVHQWIDRTKNPEEKARLLKFKSTQGQTVTNGKLFLESLQAHPLTWLEEDGRVFMTKRVKTLFIRADSKEVGATKGKMGIGQDSVRKKLDRLIKSRQVVIVGTHPLEVPPEGLQYYEDVILAVADRVVDQFLRKVKLRLPPPGIMSDFYREDSLRAAKEVVKFLEWHVVEKLLFAVGPVGALDRMLLAHAARVGEYEWALPEEERFFIGAAMTRDRVEKTEEAQMQTHEFIKEVRGFAPYLFPSDE